MTTLSHPSLQRDPKHAHGTQPRHRQRRGEASRLEGSVSCTTVARMRKIVAGVVGVVLILTAAACGSSSPTANKGTTKTPTTASVGTLKGKTGAQILKAGTN